MEASPATSPSSSAPPFVQVLPRLIVAFVLLVSLSAVQLYVQTVAAEQDSSFLALFLSNLVASSPWLPLAVVILWLTERVPPRPWLGLLVHVLASVAVSLFFLAWLALFHLLVTSGGWSSSLYLAWLRTDLAEFFTVSLLVYGLIVLVGLALHSFSALAKERSARREAQRELDASPGRDSEASSLVVRATGRRRLVRPAEIDWIEAEGVYVRLHVGETSYLLRRPLGDLARELLAEGFVRIHRSTMVNLERIVELRPLTHGEARLVLRGGRELKVSRTYRQALRERGL